MRPDNELENVETAIAYTIAVLIFVAVLWGLVFVARMVLR